MLARPYHFSDARGCDALTKHLGITAPGIDEIYVTGPQGKPNGLLVSRECAYIHELECGEGITARLRADALANYAVAASRTKGIKSAIFLIRGGNARMMRWAESLGAIKQTEPGDELYLLTPP